jgi:Na+/melibiose symporter-like transporter
VLEYVTVWQETGSCPWRMMADPRPESQPRSGDFNEATRWNFTVMAAESAAFQIAMSWVDPIAVLPLFIDRLAQSTVLVGLVTVLQRLGWILPQLPMAAILGHRPRRLPYLQWGVFFGRLPFLAFVVYLWIYGIRNPGFVLAFMMVGYLSVALGNGIVTVSWQDIIAKSIPGTVRGRFFATMQFATAVGAVGVGFGVRMMLGPSGPGFPLGYTILFTCMAVFLCLSTLGCAITREPIRPVLERPQSVRQLIGSARPMLRDHGDFRGLVLIAILGSSMSFTTPFYVVYATRILGVPEQLAGVYIWASVLGGAGFSILWGHLNDRRGPLTVIRAGCAFVIIAPVLAVSIPLVLRAVGIVALGSLPLLPYVFALVFVVGGSTNGALWMGSMNYLFELCDHRDRPRYIAILNYLALPGALVPLLIGWLLDYLPYQLVFCFIASSGIAAALVSRRMSQSPQAFQQGQASPQPGHGPPSDRPPCPADS